MTEFLQWYAIIWLIGLLALPLSFSVFHRLPDRGYSLARPLGLLVLGIICWWVGNLKILPFTPLTCWLMLGVMAALSVTMLLVRRRRLLGEMLDWLGEWRNLRLIVVSELIFFAAFAFIVNYRSFLPDLNASEKLFDLAFIQAIAASPDLPPPDPWFGGRPMNYYYGGQMLLAVLVKMSGVPASTAYNVAMGLVFAMAAQSCYSLGSNFWAAARGRVIASTFGGVVGASFIMFVGNIAPARQFFVKGPADILSGKLENWLDWPSTARIIYDFMPAINGHKEPWLMDVLTEYPIYSWLNGDLHAHLIGIPFVVLILGFVLNIWLAKDKWALGQLPPYGVLSFITGGLLVGAPFLINGGDFPTYLALTIIVIGLAEWRFGGQLRQVLGRWVVQAGLLGVGIGLVYLPFFTNFNGMIRGEPLPSVQDVPIIGWFSKYLGGIYWPRTFMAEYVTMYGIFLFAIVSLIIMKLIKMWLDCSNPDDGTPDNRVMLLVRGAGGLLVIVGLWGLPLLFGSYGDKNLSLTSAVVPFIALPAAVICLWPGQKVWQAVRRRPVLAITVMVLLVLTGIGPQINFELLGPVSALLVASVALVIRDVTASRQDKAINIDVLALTFVALASAISLAIEVVYVRDIYNNRFNTLFKFWYQIWMLLGMAAVYSVWRVVTFWQKGATVEASPQPVLVREPALATATVAADGAPPEHRLRSSLIGTPNQAALSADGGNPDTPLPPAEPPQPSRRFRPLTIWRGVWIAILILLLGIGSAILLISYPEMTNKYQNRIGLNGERWYWELMPAEHKAMVWLRDQTYLQPDKRGVVLEANGNNYSWFGRISSYTGLPTVVGWPFHELQWRAASDPNTIWQPYNEMDEIYRTEDAAHAEELLKKNNVRYVFVGQIENGSRGGLNDQGDRSGYKHYSPAALAKFGQFMKTIYADPENNVYIYAFY